MLLIKLYKQVQYNSTYRLACNRIINLFLVNGKIKSAAQVLIHPIEIAQLLYSERCINKVALDEVERLEGSLENKMTTLLSAIHTAVSFDHQNIKVFGTVLSKFEEMRSLGNEVLTLHGKSKVYLYIYLNKSLCSFNQPKSSLMRKKQFFKR